MPFQDFLLFSLFNSYFSRKVPSTAKPSGHSEVCNNYWAFLKQHVLVSGFSLAKIANYAIGPKFLLLCIPGQFFNYASIRFKCRVITVGNFEILKKFVQNFTFGASKTAKKQLKNWFFDFDVSFPK